MIQQQDPSGQPESSQPGSTIAGVDVGATLTKLAVQAADGSRRFEILSSRDLDGATALLERCEVERAGLTGGGAGRLAERLACQTLAINEFAAWGAGSRQMLERAEGGAPARFLAVSLGTGTSALLVDGLSTQRIGGTALGGGTVLGLGCALSGAADFEALCALAEVGDCAGVDLRVADIYGAGEIPLAGEITAANFGRLGANGSRSATPADLAAGVMNLVGENVGLVCGGLAAAAQVTMVAFGGSTLRCNPALVRSLTAVTGALGREPTLLEHGEHAGALGALELARARG